MSREWSVVGAAMSGVSVACALAVTVAVVRREFTATDEPTFRPRSIRDYSPVPVEDWDLLMAGGHRIGAESAVLKVVEFGDFQCPACRRFHESAMSPLLAQHPEQVSLIFYHWPLPYHRDAYAGARAAECAADQGRFAEMVDALYRWQDSLGHSPPQFFADVAKVPDQARFSGCAVATDSVSVINRHMELARRLGGIGTPTLIMNGQILRYVPDSAGLAAIFEQARKGQL